MISELEAVTDRLLDRIVTVVMRGTSSSYFLRSFQGNKWMENFNDEHSFQKDLEFHRDNAKRYPNRFRVIENE